MNEPTMMVKESSPMDLHWLHQFVDIDCKTQHGKTVSYEIEEFGTYYDGGDAQQQEVLADVDTFLDDHSSMNLDFMEFLSVQVIHPIEYTLRHGVEDIEKSAEITRLRKKKAIFIITHIIPRIYHHDNFVEIQESVARAVTGLLVLIGTIYAAYHQHDKESLSKTATFFKAKGFLASIAFQIWSVCLYEQSIQMVDRTVPTLRQLAMMDVVDESWKYSGSWENLLRLLEERHGHIVRIAADRSICDNSVILRRARTSLRNQVESMDALHPSGGEICYDVHSMTDQIYNYFPKCSAYRCANIETPDKPHRLRCYRCHYFHWCSPACRQYSEEIAQHHDIFCENCPQEKADDCQAEMRDYLNIPNIQDQDDDSRVKCHSCGLKKGLSPTMNRCSRCKAVYYCSRMCQTWDWNHGDHRSKCDETEWTNN